MAKYKKVPKHYPTKNVDLDASARNALTEVALLQGHFNARHPKMEVGDEVWERVEELKERVKKLPRRKPNKT